MGNRQPCATDEWYHCYNRGTDKRVVFTDPRDYERFRALLYVSNATRPLRISDISQNTLHEILNNDSLDRGQQLVDIGAYALMPTHPHLVLRQLTDGGIARFMQRVFTGYTMYFNLRNARTGALFAGTYKSRHITDDDYLKQVIPYVLLNPAELFEPNWKKGIGSVSRIKKLLSKYSYSNFQEFAGVDRPEKKIMGRSIYEYYEKKTNVSGMLHDALAYYRSQSPEL